MRSHKLLGRCIALLLSASFLLSLAACGGKEKTTAAAMHLTRAEGRVSVSDDAGSDVPLLDNLGLYSGYGVRTRSESYAWINLDDVKLTKMDEDSRIAIKKDGKELEIEVKSGGLFFNVTKPLEEDETMNIRTSTMLVGIRGTCGWVVDQDGLSQVYLLEGKVRCSSEDQTAQIQAGEVATVTEDGNLTVTEFTVQDIPAFVKVEVEDDDDLMQAVLDNSGTGSDSEDEQPPEESTEPEEPPTDGDRVVFTGTLNSYAFDGVLALQGISNMAPYFSDTDGTYWLIVLDTPQTMTLQSASGDGSRSGPVSIIGVFGVGGLEQYRGQSRTFSIDPNQTWWPSDVSLPDGQPRTSDVRVLVGDSFVALSAGAEPDAGAESDTSALAGLNLASWWTPRSGEFVDFKADNTFQYSIQDVSYTESDVTSWTVALDRVEKTGDYSYSLHVSGVLAGEHTYADFINGGGTTTGADSSGCPFQPGDTVWVVLPGAGGGGYSINGTAFEPY